MRLVLQLLPERTYYQDLKARGQEDYKNVRVVPEGLQDEEQGAVHEEIRSQLHQSVDRVVATEPGSGTEREMVPIKLHVT